MSGEKKVILLIEDSEIAAMMAAQSLESGGFEVRTATGPGDLEEKIKADEGFLQGIDMMILDMMLEETHERHREDKSGSLEGVAMTGSQVGVSLMLAHPQLRSVPFLIYSSKDPEEIESHLEELFEFAELDENINKNYRGFVSKSSESGSELLEKAIQILSGES
jgi:CheY-like chemotaxis protein